jgi:hypothetical protein
MIDTKPTNPKDVMATTKVPLALCSPVAKAYWAVAQYLGAKKYGSWNWRAAGVLSSVYVNAAHRHLDAWWSGEEYDEEGTHNLGAVMACIGILLDARTAGKLVDDRPPSVDVRPVFEECSAAIQKAQEAHADKNPRHYTIADTVTQPAAPKLELKVGAKVLVLYPSMSEGRVIAWCADRDNNSHPWWIYSNGSYSWHPAANLEVIG